jgi:hypothetical protein
VNNRNISVSVEPSSALRLIAFLTEPASIRTLFAHLGEPTTPSPRAPPGLDTDRAASAAFAFDQSPSWDLITPPPDPGFSFDQTLACSPGPRVASLPTVRALPLCATDSLR